MKWTKILVICALPFSIIVGYLDWLIVGGYTWWGYSIRTLAEYLILCLGIWLGYRYAIRKKSDT